MGDLDIVQPRVQFDAPMAPQELSDHSAALFGTPDRLFMQLVTFNSSSSAPRRWNYGALQK